ncbi:hypothetical protein KUTeg_023865 [Tegillarca granosa]|uniref:Transmembrane protein 183 n=1 Tax=Tegillarca granosa TaxID=220873 RepID=A0ABQ9E8H3_TEGGR|nr:hypothetical protein KUTeg_023865 [Tegillarca granosa]
MTALTLSKDILHGDISPHTYGLVKAKLISISWALETGTHLHWGFQRPSSILLCKLDASHPHRKHRSKHLNAGFVSQNDVTIHEFADSSKQVNGNRLKKGFSTKSVPEMANSNLEQQEELSWFDKDLDDFEIDSQIECDDSEEEEQLKESHKLKHVGSNTKDDDGKCIQRMYPVDLWLALSFHIDPEDIGRFAGICRYANMAVHTVQFWKHLYQTYCLHNTSILPDDLQPCTLERIHGLRQRVIRSLFYVHSPLVERIKTTIPFENEPYHLIGQRCILHWHEKVKNKWVFNFKFKNETITSERNYIVERKRHYDLFRGHNDLFYNPLNGCCMLQVVCHNFINIPPILGLLLSQIYLKVGHGMRYHCLKLVFNSSVNSGNLSANRYGVSGDVVVMIDPAINLKVFPWWNPQYQIS